MQETTVLSLSYGQIVVKPVEQHHGLVPASFETYQVIEPGDIIIRPTDLQNDWTSLRFGLSRHHGTITSAYMCFHTRAVISREYGHLLLHTYDLKKIFYGLGSGLRQNLNWRDFQYLPCLVPPLPDQNAIVRYVNYATERIRSYINAKERLINLLEEQRQAIIHRAVTRGFDPNVRLKPSGVEWLGDVPAHWEVRRLRNVGEALIGLTYAPQDVIDEEDGILVLRASNISGGRIVYEDNVFVRCSVPSRLITRIGDILICSRSGSQTLIGKNARIDLASSGVTFGAFMTIFRSTNNDYLYYVFNSKLFEYQSGAYQTSTINQLTLNILYDIKIPLPPLAEQKQITRYLDRITSSIDTAINCARREIELLKEYRTRLIADVVTGKLDVRQAAFELPEKSDRLSPCDDVNDSTEIRMIDDRTH